MTKSFTTNDLIRYIYQEMEEEENDQLVQLLQDDQQLMQEYIDLLSTIEKLDIVLIEPSDSIINAIKKRHGPKDWKKYNTNNSIFPVVSPKRQEFFLQLSQSKEIGILVSNLVLPILKNKDLSK
ncbi:hypothetical protein [Cyclobacterium qasimii]|uniref:Uncharacterized protein n=1 Tax=Cyclobacterium qasimii M12-11B TaxID=641524 RepID=S7V6M1_9BACT|nr:hypothetical protein [Cyclobacterium qasimii]EPR65207.1 hypothetical protein ADICYQ_5740 [Cyclobacterium qasimii M12-11B]